MLMIVMMMEKVIKKILVVKIRIIFDPCIMLRFSDQNGVSLQ